LMGETTSSSTFVPVKKLVKFTITMLKVKSKSFT